MALITPLDFKGETHIAQLSQLPVREAVTLFIDKYEPELLRKLIGVTMYNDLVAGMGAVPVDQKWLNLMNGEDYGSPAVHWVGLKSLIVNYVYYYFQQDYNTHTTQAGVAKPKAENSVPVSPVDKMVRAWNEFVKWTCEMHEYIKAHESDYPNYAHLDRESICRDYHCGCRRYGALYRVKNSLGL